MVPGGISTFRLAPAPIALWVARRPGCGQSALAMALPPKPILIRIVLWGGLISYVGWEAYDRHRQQNQAEAAVEAAKAADPLAPNSSIRLKDGSEMPVLELTEEEFEQRFGHKPPETAVSAEELRDAVDEARKHAGHDATAPAPPPTPVPEPNEPEAESSATERQHEGGGDNREHTLQ
jgi:hypothetical protein